MLENVSALAWDQNESFPQFSGNHTILTHGYETVLKQLAKGLDLRLNTEVISYSDIEMWRNRSDKGQCIQMYEENNNNLLYL